MRFRWIFLVMIVVIFASIAAVSADEMNETLAEGTIDDLVLEDDIVLESPQEEISIENSSEDNVLNAYDDENSIILEKDSESSQKSESPLYGIVDIGSNSMSLEIYKIKDSGKPKSVFSLSEKSVTSVYVENGNLSQAGIDKLVSVMKDFNDAMDLVGVKTKYAFATASLRKINNSEEVIAAVRDKTGLDIHLISGEKEANSSFNSVKDTELTTDKGIVIDLGGGSCEVIDFINKTVITSESMPIGSSSCYKEYVNGLFPNDTEVMAIQNRVLSELEKLAVTNSTSRSDLFGIGGSVKTIKKLSAYLGYIDSDADCIPVSMLDDLFNEFRGQTREVYEKILNVNAERINTFLPGLIITKTIADYFNVSYLHFCKNGVREGILYEILANESRYSKSDVFLNVTDIDIASDENAEIPITLPGNATGTVTVKVADGTYSASLNGGSCIIALAKLPAGNYSAKITYSGDDNYESNKTKITIHVKSASLDAYDMTRALRSDYDYQVKLIDDAGKGIAGKLVSFTVMSKQYNAVTNEDGIASIKANLDAGTYDVYVSSEIAGNATHALKIVSRFEGSRNLSVGYASGALYKIRIIGDDGNPEREGQSVAVLVDNKMQSLKTDKNGYVAVAIDKDFTAGTHSIEVLYKGVVAKNKVLVKHALSLKSATVKKSAKKLVLSASLAKVNGKYLKNRQVTFKFNGKTYKAKTNSKGVAKVTVKSSVLKKLKAGKKVTYQATYLKDTVKKTSKVKR